MPLSCWQYLSSSKNFIHCTVGTWSNSDDFTHSWIISAVCLKQDTIVWDDPIKNLQKISEGKFFQGRKGLKLQEGTGWSTACWWEHQPLEQSQLKSNQPRQADEHRLVCASRGKHLQGYLQRLLHWHGVPENTPEMNNLLFLLIVLIVL